MRCSWIHRAASPLVSPSKPLVVVVVRGVRILAGGPRHPQPGPPTLGGGGPNPPHLVSEDHQAIALPLMARPTHWAAWAHGVKGEKVVFTDLELVPRYSSRACGCRDGGQGHFSHGPRGGAFMSVRLSPARLTLENAALGVDSGAPRT